MMLFPQYMALRWLNVFAILVVADLASAFNPAPSNAVIGIRGRRASFKVVARYSHAERSIDGHG
jgi:hypothetical protein